MTNDIAGVFDVRVTVRIEKVKKDDLRGQVVLEFEALDEKSCPLDGIALSGTRIWLGGKVTPPCYSYFDKNDIDESGRAKKKYVHFLNSLDPKNFSSVNNFKRFIAEAFENMP
jgi:hypothetical protein